MDASKLLTLISNISSSMSNSIGNNQDYCQRFEAIYFELKEINKNIQKITDQKSNVPLSDSATQNLSFIRKELGIPSSEDSSEDDELFMQAVNKFETEIESKNNSLNEPASIENVDIDSQDTDDLMIASLLENEAGLNSAGVDNQDANDQLDESLENENDKKYHDVLKRFYGYSAFRPSQLKIIKSVIENKRDNLVIMATGLGKSLCYQFPSIYLNGITLVISPLISLMEDQVRSLQMVNVNAAFLGSAQDDRDKIEADLFNHKYRVLYLTPEYIESCSDMLESLNNKIGIDLVAIDECHCVSQWGHDFRPSYQKIGSILRQQLKNVPFMALTATAAPELRVDIMKSLQLKNPLITVSSFDRPNLYISVSYKSNSMVKDFETVMLGDNKTKFDGPTIVYCPTKKITGEVTELLKTLGIKCEMYHADLPLPTRKRNQQKFLADEIDVVVATIAFGMGIDKPDVRNVIHYGAPKDLESYYQEIGRAGRDGLQSKCHVFFAQQDFSLARFFLKDISSQKFREHKTDMLNKMIQFLTTSQCRRRFLLKHFDPNEPLLNDTKQFDNCCDNCTTVLVKGVSNVAEKDFTEDAKKLFETIKLLNERYGLNTYIGYLVGSKAQNIIGKIPSFVLKNKLYGSATNKNQNWWKTFAQQLKNEGYLNENPILGSFGSTISLTASAENALSDNNIKIVLQETECMKREIATKLTVTLNYGNQILPLIAAHDISNNSQNSSSKTNAEDAKKENELMKDLMLLRNDIANEFGLSSHKVATNKILGQFALMRPSKIENLQRIEDFPKEKAEKIGSRFIEKIRQFCNKNDLKMDNFCEEDNTQDSIDNLSASDPKIKELLSNMTPAKQSAYVAFQIEKKSLSEIAAMRGVAESTIISYLADAITIGLPLNYNRLNIKDETIDFVEDKIRKPPINSNVSKLTPIKEQCGDISWEDLKIIVALLKRKYGLYDEQKSELNQDDDKKQAVISLNTQNTTQTTPNTPNRPLTATVNASNSTPLSEQKGRPMPNWFKKRPSESDSQSDQDKTKKKPKFNM